MPIINAENIVHSYISEGSLNHSLDRVSFQIKKGEFISVMGQNGCGKSTLARHLNALIPLQNGNLTIAGLDAFCSSNIWKIRQVCGMVFQNPDNQFVSSIIREDIAFGPRNFGTPESEIPDRVSKALQTTGMSGYEEKSPHLLSGGQKQRIAIAGVLAADPDIIIFDEVTSMLDPEGRRDVLDTIHRLHQDGKTIIMISHYIEETVFSDRIILMKNGTIAAQGVPEEILTDPKLLQSVGLTPPLAVRAFFDLSKAGIHLSRCPLTINDLAEALCQLH